MSQDKTEKMEYFISLLDDYIDGKLGASQTSEIEQALKEDPFLNEVLKQHVQARANMRTAGEQELRSKFANSFDPIPEVEKPKSNTLKIFLVILMLLGLAFASYLYFSNQEVSQEQRPFTASVEEQDGRLLLASVEDPSYDLLRSERDSMIADSWQQAVQYFIAEDYEEADSIITSLEQDTVFIQDHKGKLSLMKGVANLKMEKYNIADQALSEISPDNPYYDQAEWYLALTYFYAGDTAEAKKMLEQIISNEGHYKRGEAQRYFDQLAKE